MNIKHKKHQIPEYLQHFLAKFTEADSEFATKIAQKMNDRYDIYHGTSKVFTWAGIETNEKAPTMTNIGFELIESQINNAIPAPKVVPRDSADSSLANQTEAMLKFENTRIKATDKNDEAERETYIQGTVLYYLDWDNSQSTPITEGEVNYEVVPISRFRPQPGITDEDNMDYMFKIDYLTKQHIGRYFEFKDWEDLPSHESNQDVVKLITCYYKDADGDVCRFGFVEDMLIFNDPKYQYRRKRKCLDCDVLTGVSEKCPNCGGSKIELQIVEEEPLDVDLTAIDPTNVDEVVVEDDQAVMIPEGTIIPYYKINQFPFVKRVNISKADSFYGISDIDQIREVQLILNKITHKINSNIVEGGTIVTKLKNMNLGKSKGPIRLLSINNPNEANAIKNINITPAIQQEDMWVYRLYTMARNTLGITESFQGRRDPTAESGRAKEIAAAQTSGRLESKRRMKNAAYTRLYEKMFKFLLAYSDEPRTYSVRDMYGGLITGKFSRLNFLESKEDQDGVYFYNDRFLFDVDNASVLSTDRELMWQEVLNNFRMGTLGHPEDPFTLNIYWHMMEKLGYPLASEALSNMRAREQMLPFELQQVIMDNPEILEQIRQQAVENQQNKKAANKGGGKANTQERRESANETVSREQQTQERYDRELN